MTLVAFLLAVLLNAHPLLVMLSSILQLVSVTYLDVALVSSVLVGKGPTAQPVLKVTYALTVLTMVHAMLVLFFLYYIRFVCYVLLRIYLLVQMLVTVLLVHLEPTERQVQLANLVQKVTIPLKESENAQRLLLGIAQMRILLVMSNVALGSIQRVVPLYILPVQQVLSLAY